MSGVTGEASVSMESQTHTDSAAGTTNTTDEIDAAWRVLKITLILQNSALDPNEEYKMSRKRRGLAIIFNHQYFECKPRMEPRFGTDADRDNLEEGNVFNNNNTAGLMLTSCILSLFSYLRLKALNFEVKAYNNCSKKKMEGILSEAAQANHSDADCFMLIFLSHGEKDHVFAHDDKININDITAKFQGDKCQSLVGKTQNHHIAGFASHRETMNGSWFIQDLCDLLLKYGESLEFTELLTLVNRKVSMRSVGYSKHHNSIGKKQVPCFASMLTKKLYFRPKQADK
ncbi:hypothetical protein WMY93_030895 [Mugilogobius chulae]|uniref:Caspase-6 n=1 Tax=Mugilogobius chulae TaxID=88201 RepID=A0AAW0MHH8_9GOBI